MAYFEERKGGWLAQVRRKGWPTQAKTFDARADAQKWARGVEREMDIGAFIRRDVAERTTFKDVAGRFASEVLPSKRGRIPDESRLRLLVQRFGKYSLAAINSTMLAAYRDERLKLMAPQTVVHELSLMSRVLRTAVLDWGIPLPQGIPTTMVRRPKLDNERERRLEADEEQQLIDALTNPGGAKPNPWMLPLFILAVETAGRQSELLSMQWDEVDLKRRVARLRGVDGRETKNGAVYRDVPLSPRAVRVLAGLPRSVNGLVFPITQSAAKQSWDRAVVRARRRHVRDALRVKLAAKSLDAEREIRAIVYKKRVPDPRAVALLAEIETKDKTLTDLHFHDLRHEATSRLAEVFEMHELMKIVGHNSAKTLGRYYHPRVEELAAKLDDKKGGE
ncbi:MAG: site-specific integrase [Proteobacteria bacterium]|nr:site-specific integrase [Pseudomonadota bacterium]